MEFQHVTIKAFSRREIRNECANFMISGYTLLSCHLYLQWPRFWRVIWIAELDNKPTYQLTDPTPEQLPPSLLCDDEKLNKALKEENYEEAARIRDRLKKQIRK
jgi:hypothetical protein